MQVKWLRKALQNLDDEAESEYIAKDDPQTAQLVVQRIVQIVSLLTENPSLGHPGRLPGTHELVIPKTRYIVPYRVRPRLQRIEILRVFHTSRKQPERW
ncbi:MAG TPA: type II toxin-antitoxin system RelE/ParE family toxin [Gammaproteobacteria bacterium]|nr:type II toxin-antitoxin system RelE/ParE family toxin [Gammaproteobacteria bacterium]